MSKDKTLTPGLYIVATPIGNLGDISYRAVETLRLSDYIIAEDKRVTAKLLSHLGIKVPLISYHDHSTDAARTKIVDLLRSDKVVSLVSDSGTPLISDPGYKLVKLLQEESIYYTIVPGPSSLIAALVLSGLASHNFYFCGFLPDKKKDIVALFDTLKPLKAALVMFEGPSKVIKCLELLHAHFSDRSVSVTREITKIYEEVISGSFEEVIKDLTQRNVIKGEYVIILSEPGAKKETDIDVDSKILELIKDMSVKDISDKLAYEFGLSKKFIYNRVIELHGKKGKK